jgi:hypothetical protein
MMNEHNIIVGEILKDNQRDMTMIKGKNKIVLLTKWKNFHYGK